eukprot:Rhum_TRINITY_DN14147_c6_g1::Rhum_TRINITY_DN14147_c6_g1_i1::g.71700::m.71700
MLRQTLGRRRPRRVPGVVRRPRGPVARGVLERQPVRRRVAPRRQAQPLRRREVAVRHTLRERLLAVAGGQADPLDVVLVLLGVAHLRQRPRERRRVVLRTRLRRLEPLRLRGFARGEVHPLRRLHVALHGALHALAVDVRVEGDVQPLRLKLVVALLRPWRRPRRVGGVAVGTLLGPVAVAAQLHPRRFRLLPVVRHPQPLSRLHLALHRAPHHVVRRVLRERELDPLRPYLGGLLRRGGDGGGHGHGRQRRRRRLRRRRPRRVVRVSRRTLRHASHAEADPLRLRLRAVERDAQPVRDVQLPADALLHDAVRRLLPQRALHPLLAQVLLPLRLLRLRHRRRPRQVRRVLLRTRRNGRAVCVEPLGGRHLAGRGVHPVGGRHVAAQHAAAEVHAGRTVEAQRQPLGVDGRVQRLGRRPPRCRPRLVGRVRRRPRSRVAQRQPLLLRLVAGREPQPLGLAQLGADRLLLRLHRHVRSCGQRQPLRRHAGGRRRRRPRRV